MSGRAGSAVGSSLRGLPLGHRCAALTVKHVGMSAGGTLAVIYAVASARYQLSNDANAHSAEAVHMGARNRATPVGRDAAAVQRCDG